MGYLVGWFLLELTYLKFGVCVFGDLSVFTTKIPQTNKQTNKRGLFSASHVAEKCHLLFFQPGLYD